MIEFVAVRNLPHSKYRYLQDVVYVPHLCKKGHFVTRFAEAAGPRRRSEKLAYEDAKETKLPFCVGDNKKPLISNLSNLDIGECFGLESEFKKEKYNVYMILGYVAKKR